MDRAVQGIRLATDGGLKVPAKLWCTMQTASKTSYWTFLTYVLLTFYCLGAAVMNEFVEYQSWADLGPYMSATDFATWHMSTTQYTVPFLTVPALLLTVVVVLLFWQLPPSVPRAALWVVLACHVVAWSSSVFVQWPLEVELSKGNFTPELMDHLLRSDWVRKLMLFIEAPLAVYMAHRALHPALSRQEAPAASAGSVPALG